MVSDKKLKGAKRYDLLLMIYTIILMILVFMMIFFSVKTYIDYHSFKNHRGYFRNNSSPEIDSWMTPNTVLRHFNITEQDLFSTLNESNNKITLVQTISSICLEKKENCTQVIERLNSKVR